MPLTSRNALDSLTSLAGFNTSGTARNSTVSGLPRSAINITPEAGFYDTLGYAYYKKRQFEVAVEQFNKAINRKPSSALYHLRLARALRDNGDTQKARQTYERALQLGGPNFAESGQARQELAALRRS